MKTQTGEEIAKAIIHDFENTCSPEAGDYVVHKYLNDKIFVPEYDWQKVKTLIDKLGDDPVCDLSFHPTGYKITQKQLDELRKAFEPNAEDKL